MAYATDQNITLRSRRVRGLLADEGFKALTPNLKSTIVSQSIKQRKILYSSHNFKQMLRGYKTKRYKKQIR